MRHYASKHSPKSVPKVVPTIPNSSEPSPKPNTTSNSNSGPRPYKSRDLKTSSPPVPEEPPSETTPEPEAPEPVRVKDPARGFAAAQEVVKTGRLPSEYKWAAAKVTAVMTSIVLLIVLTPVLFGRVVQGKERKRLVVPGGAEHVVRVEEGLLGVKGGEYGEGLLPEEIDEGEGVEKEKEGTALRFIVGEDKAAENSRRREG